MTEYKKTGHVLPPEVVSAFDLIGNDLERRNLYAAALRRTGWTLASISAATGITRERVRQIESATDEVIDLGRLDLPIPQPPAKAVKLAKVYVEPDADKLARLMELQPLAQQNRHNSDEYRQAAEEYTALVWQVHNEDGVTLYRLAKALGVTHGALRFRLARYGYKESAGGRSKVYTRIMPEHRVSLDDVFN